MKQWLLLPWLSACAVFAGVLCCPVQSGAGTRHGRTWYVRPDGGTRLECTGLTDRAYNRRSGQDCALAAPTYLYSDGHSTKKAWIVHGGDTVVLRGGPYRMGYKGPNARDGWAFCPGDPFGCIMPPIPSGTSSAPTRILGEDYRSCHHRTQLFGGFGLNAVLNLKGSSHVDLECLEITDHGSCSRVGAGLKPGEGCHSFYPLSDYAGNGIITDARTTDLVLHNIDIHGLTSRGILGPIGGPVRVDHVRIAFNGGAGWDFDDGEGTPSAGAALVDATYLTIEWNGCNEEYPLAHAVPAASCYDQNSGGYGDGIGTPDTGLSFSCAHCIFRYNTQDGLDLLHARGGTVLIEDSEAYGNMGQQWKIGPMRRVLFRNNRTVNNCRRLDAPFAGAMAGYDSRLSLYCRAAGEGVRFTLVDGGDYRVTNNSFAGYGATSYAFGCAGECADSTLVFENNLLIGYPDPRTGLLPGVIYTDGFTAPVFKARDHNLYYRMRTCPAGMAESCVNPDITQLPLWNGEASLDALDFRLRPGSPAMGTGICGPDAGGGKPAQAQCDIGASR